MAISLLVSWLNEDLKLSRKVKSFGEDFKNGYLFGEILTKYHMYRDYVVFSDKNTQSCKFENFRTLEPQLKSLGIEFNGMIAQEIM
jgi:hypothetical protein